MATAPNTQVFEDYFNKADLDKDGRISGAEAVAFFQGSNLPKQILAQIWMYAGQNKTAFLGRPEFYNALKLVTVAQSGKELTSEIVRSVLYGPVSAQIPAPRINFPSTPQQLNSIPATASVGNSMVLPPVHLSSMGPIATQTRGTSGPRPLPGLGTNQQNVIRPPQAPPVALPLQGMGQGLPGGNNMLGPHLSSSNASNLSTDWPGKNFGASVAATAQVPVSGVALSANQEGFKPAASGTGDGMTMKPESAAIVPSSLPPKPIDSPLPPTQLDSKDSKTSVVAGFSSDSVFGGDAFSAIPSAKQASSMPIPAANNMENPSTGASGATPPQHSVIPVLNDSLHSKPPLPPSGSHLQKTHPLTKQNQLDPVKSASTLSHANASTGNIAQSQSQQPWPKIRQADIQKYGAVFVKVDKDRDGKITGSEARNLFLSWRLPREVLKQVWDLSDQDNDSMLSLQEFCIALYLMERYREGRPLPSVLPNSIKYDETLLLATNQQSSTAYTPQQPSAGYVRTQQSSTSYGGSPWQPGTGLQQQGLPGPGLALPTPGVKQTVPAPGSTQPDGTERPSEPKSKVPVLEKHLVDQLSKEEQSALNSKFDEATDAEKKVQELEKEILESKEKMEFYRNKLQELVLYKSRCDSRLNEVTERAAADKREAELLARKYEEKYKQIGGDIASRLTLEEATFRDIQERKLKLYNAIIKMEQGENADGALQGRADGIKSDLEELVKTLNERCKQYGLRAKPTSLLELPFGWQPGIQEAAADWSEDWDKFDDEGFTIVKELTVEVENIVAPPKSKTCTVQSKKISDDEVYSSSSSKVDDRMKKPSSNGEGVPEAESHDARSDGESAHRTPGSPERSADIKSPDFDHDSSQAGFHDNSPHAKESLGDHDVVESSKSTDKFAEEPSWGANFDGSDDADSIWGFRSLKAKDNDHDQSRRSSFFDSGDFGLTPIKTSLPNSASVVGREKGPFFDSVPSTPAFDSVSVAGREKGSFFDSFPSTPAFESVSMVGREKGFFFDSVPSTPAFDSTSAFNSGFSPRFNEGAEDHAFSSFSRFDSFNMQDGGLFPQHDFGRFDSMHSTAENSRGDSFSRFDSFCSTSDQGPTFSKFDSLHSTADQAPTFTRFDSIRSTTTDPAPTFTRFDSIRSTTNHSRGFSFDDSDPFDSTGPFKYSGSYSQKGNTDNWSSF